MRAPDSARRPTMDATIADPAGAPGRVSAVHGSVIDIRFSAGSLPSILDAVAIDWDLGRPLIAEIHQHLDRHTVRAVALSGTSGLRRGTAARPLSGPISVPVGDAVLGRLLNVVGTPVDRGPALPADVQRRPIHASAPAIGRQSAAIEMFHTGIKVIDLLAPLVKGSKAAMFGGAGVGTFHNKRAAERKRSELQSRFISVLKEVDVLSPNSSNTRYRVMSRLKDRHDADSACASLKRDHQTCEVVIAD